jgi:type I restriction enzyme S subunit
VGTFKINNQQVRHLCFALPSVPEQQKILDCLAEAVGPITTAAHQAGNEISLFREYRTRLIADVITGKLDVREVVAKLAEEPEAETESIAESTMDEDESSECEEVAGSGAIG